MRTKLSLFCDKVIEAGWLAAVIIVPLFFNIYSQRVFEPDKLSLLRSIAVVMGVAWLIRLAEDWRSRDPEEEVRASLWSRLYKKPLVLPTLLLVLVYIISTLASVTPSVSFWGSYQRLQGTYTTFSYIVIFFLMLDALRTKRQLNRLVTVLILISFPIALYGLVQHFGLDPLPWGGNVSFRVASNMGNAIFVAAYLIMVVPLTLSRVLENWKEAVDGFDTADGILGAVSFVVLAGALLVAMFLARDENAGWVSWLVLLVGAVLSASLSLLRPAEQRSRVLAISLPLTFAFLVGLVWILEIPFPPANSRYFGWGLMASLVFLVAMVPFAFYLRKPVSRLLLLAGYFVILVTQLVTIFYTQSRGPLLGLIGGLFFYLALLGLIKRRIWITWLVTGGAVTVATLLLVFNLVNSPLTDSFRNVPYVGRLGRLLQTESGTGKVRVLIWEGAAEMIGWHPPLETPGPNGGPDPLNAIRPFIGYGPESMYVAYNRFYQPDLAHVEKRTASPDRSHNETFDALVTTGGIGFLIYMALFTSVFYFGLKWLGLIRKRWQTWTFLALWVGGGLLGAAVVWFWRGPYYIGVGIPGGEIVGLGVYVFIVLLRTTLKRDLDLEVGSRYSLWMLALIAAVVAHFIEIHLGIAIAATRTYFWTYAAIMTVIGTRLAMQPAAAEQMVTLKGEAKEHEAASHHRRRRGSLSNLESKAAPPDRDWQASVLTLCTVAILVLSTLLFDYMTVQQGNPGVLAILWRSLTQSSGHPSPVLLVLFLSTLGMIGLIGLGDLATREESAGKEPKDWLAAAGLFALVSLGGALFFGLLHATRLKPVNITSADAPNPLSNTITFYYVAVFLIGMALAAVLTFMFNRSTKPGRWNGDLADMGVVALGAVLPVLAMLWINSTNISIVRADILYKQGLSSENASQWDGAIYFYDQALQVAKNQDFYYLFLGRALMEKGKASPEPQRETWLQQSEQALMKARDIAPLNTDHSANLARLYRTWGGLLQGDQRTQLLNKSLDYYADATNLSPHNAQLFNEWGQTYLVLGDYDQALAMYQKSLSLDSQFAQTDLLLGEIYLQQKDWSKAIDYYEKALQLQPKSPEAYSSLGYAYTQTGDLDAALQAYQQAAQLSPQDYVNHKNLAILYQQMGQTEEAVNEATQALNLAPDNQKKPLQDFLASLGHPSPTASPDVAQKVQDLLTQGQGQMDAQDWQAAEATYNQILELDPGNVFAHSALAYVYAKDGQLDQAIAENLAVLSQMPADYNSHKNLAILYQQTGQIDKAIAEAEQALTLAPDDEKATVQTYLDQLKQTGGGSSSTPEPGTKAGDLAPADRNNMYSAAPAMTIDPGKKYQATIVTKRGNIVVDLAAADAPQTVNNFVFLAQQGFYDGLTFHRVENQTGFSLIQGGDPTGTGRGGPGYTVPAEIGLLHNEGAIAMARLGDEANPQRASSGSQFYICLEPIHQLDGAYTVFGYVVQGLDVAKSVSVGDEILSIVISEQ
jgi:cyclophilin family peptidyl-prolyl cis-trans isomerase/tetratricopeptide (TPR) repeat protein